MRNDRERLLDILTSVELARQMLPDSFAAFQADLKGQFAIIRLIEIIGEACARVSPAIRDAHPEVPWRPIIGTRNRLVHAYFEVDLMIVWAVAAEQFAVLAPQIRAILAELDD